MVNTDMARQFVLTEEQQRGFVTPEVAAGKWVCVLLCVLYGCNFPCRCNEEYCAVCMYVCVCVGWLVGLLVGWFVGLS